MVLDFNEVQSYYMQEDKLILYNKTRLFKIRVDICSDFDYTILNPNWRLNSMKQLGMRLRALREGIGLSQSKFADVIGSTQSSINRYETVRQRRQLSFCASMRTILTFQWTIFLPAAMIRTASCMKRNLRLTRTILN